MTKQKLVTAEKEGKSITIDGLEDFPLEVLGLTPDSIEKSKGHIKIPIELLPYLKICKMPVLSRKNKAKAQYRYLLRLKAKESKQAIEKRKAEMKAKLEIPAE